MAITNTSKPGATSLTNTARVAVGGTWATITTTWATETRTWGDMASFMTNITRVTPSITNIAKP